EPVAVLANGQADLIRVLLRFVPAGGHTGQGIVAEADVLLLPGFPALADEPGEEHPHAGQPGRVRLFRRLPAPPAPPAGAAVRRPRRTAAGSRTVPSGPNAASATPRAAGR